MLLSWIEKLRLRLAAGDTARYRLVDSRTSTRWYVAHLQKDGDTFFGAEVTDTGCESFSTFIRPGLFKLSELEQLPEADVAVDRGFRAIPISDVEDETPGAWMDIRNGWEDWSQYTGQLTT